MHPPTYCSEDDRPNEVIICPFKLDSKWSTDTQAPGLVYEYFRAPSVSGLLMGVEYFVGCLLAFPYSNFSHLSLSHFAAPVNLVDVNG